MKKTLITLAALAASVASAASIGEWNFEENLNATVGTSGKQNTYSTGTITYVDSVKAGALNVPGSSYMVATDMGKAVQLVDNTSWISLESTTYTTTVHPEHDFTMSTYVNFSAFSTANDPIVPVFGTCNGTTEGIVLGIRHEGDGYGLTFTRPNLRHEATGKITGLTADAWHHIAVSYVAETQTATWYLDGSLAATYTLSSTELTSFDSNSGCAIGSWAQDANKDDYTGGSMMLDHMQIYDTALTAAEIRTNAGLMLIPEPTTATLSLLALAGLAARRRRK